MFVELLQINWIFSVFAPVCSSGFFEFLDWLFVSQKSGAAEKRKVLETCEC
jgi:hypothetical protein